MGERSQLRCPKCGSSGLFRLLREITVWHEVQGGFTNQSVVEVDGLYKRYHGYDALNYRLECSSEPYCGHEFPLPDDFELEWI